MRLSPGILPLVALGLAGCDTPLPPSPLAAAGACRTEAVGGALPTLPGARLDPHAHPLPLDDAGTGDAAVQAHVGRAPRRLDLDQFRASLEQLLGAPWTGPQTVRTPAAPSGTEFEPDADLLEFFAPSLGRPDYVTSTFEVFDPTVTFAKLATDAARAVCAAGVRRDVTRAAADRRILVEVTETDTLPASEPAIRQNLSVLALKLWAAELAPDSGEVTAMLTVFRAAVAEPGSTPLDGWRAVCIDLATDPHFWTY